MQERPFSHTLLKSKHPCNDVSDFTAKLFLTSLYMRITSLCLFDSSTLLLLGNIGVLDSNHINFVFTLCKQLKYKTTKISKDNMQPHSTLQLILKSSVHLIRWTVPTWYSYTNHPRVWFTQFCRLNSTLAIIHYFHLEFMIQKFDDNIVITKSLRNNVNLVYFNGHKALYIVW